MCDVSTSFAVCLHRPPLCHRSLHGLCTAQEFFVSCAQQLTLVLATNKLIRNPVYLAILVVLHLVAFALLAAVHCAGTSSCEFARSTAAATAASLLGVNLQSLSDCVFLPSNATHPMSAIDRLDNFVSALYSELLLSLKYLINRLVPGDLNFSLLPLSSSYLL